MKRLSVVLAGSALAMSAHAVSWLEVSESQTGSIFSLDLDSIERSNIHIIDEKAVENITVSIRRTYPAPKSETKPSKEIEKKETGLHHSEQQWLISCKDASYYRRAYVHYAADDKVLKSWQSEKPILTTKDFKLTKSKTISRLLIEQVCKNYQQAKSHH